MTAIDIISRANRAPLALFLALALCAAVLSGCGQGEPVSAIPAPTEPPAGAEPAPSPTSEPSPRPGGVLRVASRLPKTLNPLLNEDATVDSLLRLVFEPLLEPDANMRPSNRLASNVNYASDGMSLIITLADGLKWADGTAITSEDIEYSLEVLRTAPERAIYKDCIRNVASCEVMDAQNIKMSFYRPFGGAAYLLCFPVIPRHFYSGAPDSLEAVLGSGLYKFARFEGQEAVVLEPSVNAFGDRPYIGEVRALITTDRETDLHAFEQGIIDLVRADISDWGRLADDDSIAAHSYATAYFDFIGFNFETPVFKELPAREAIARAIDKGRLLTDVYLNGGGAAVNAPIPANSWLYEPDTESYAFDAEKAQSLLSATGARVVRILVNEENEERIKIAETLRENLAQSGVSIVVESESFADYEQRLEEGDFDLVVAGFHLSLIPELSFAFGTGGEKNYFGYADTEMDALLAAMFSAPNEAAYRRAASELQKFFASGLPCVSLAFRNSVVLTDTRVRGAEPPSVTNPFMGVERWFIHE